MEKMLQWRYNRLKTLLIDNMTGKISTVEMWAQMEKIRNEISLLESMQ